MIRYSMPSRGLMLFVMAMAVLALGSVSLAAQSNAATPSVAVQDQSIVDSRVVIAKVVSATPGWIVIHSDNAGKPGPVVGYAAIRSGENLSVVVAVDAKKVTPVLYAMLHVDEGVVGAYEFPGADKPTMSSGMMVSPAFKVTAPM
jgi:hypothetical protein